MDARWKVRVIEVPASTGTVAYTGFGGTPKAVIFYGTNWLTEDTAITDTQTALFRGMAAPKYDDPGTIVQGSDMVAPAGDFDLQLSTRCIACRSGPVTDLYVATFTSFDAGGFSLTWNTVASGYKVVAIALMAVDNSGAFSGITNQSSLSFGFKSEASLIHGGLGGPQLGSATRTQQFFGGAAYPGTNPNVWMSAGMSCGCFPTSTSAQYVNELTNNAPGTRVATGMHFSGPFLVTSNITAVPTGTGLLNHTFNGDAEDGGMLLAWDDCPSATGFATVPTAEDDQTTESGLPFAPGLLLGYSISDEPTGQGTGGRGAAGFAVVTPDFQWCAMVDGVSSRGSYQSFQRGFVDRVSGTSVHAGTIELTDDGFVMTTVEDDLTPDSWLWHAFGHPTPFGWLPHIYRRVSG